ncbi:MAG: YhjD/YihY/BrkB family envelope integrity protein [Anaerorhabdus sp.]
MKNKEFILKIKAIYKMVFSLEGSLFRYSLAYGLLLSLLPVLLAIVLLFQKSIFFSIESTLNYLYRFIPQDLIIPFIDYISSQSSPSGITLIVSIVIALYLASRSIYSFMLISAKYENFMFPKIIIRIKSILVFLLLLTSFFALGLFFAFVPIIGSIKVITSIVTLFIVLFIFFRTLTFEKRPLNYGIYGTIFTSISLILTGLLFLYFVREFSSYATLYGPLSSLVITLLSLYVISTIIYTGYCINVVFAKKVINPIFKHQNFFNKIDNILKNSFKNI